MPSISRRNLLGLIGSGSAALLAGCQTRTQNGTATERSAQPTSSTETPTATVGETESVTESPPETVTQDECAPVLRPEAAWPVPRRSPAHDSYVADPERFADAPSMAWEVQPVPHGDDYAEPSYGQPVGDSAYLHVTNQLEKGPQRPVYGHIHTLTAERGERQWTSDRLRSPSHPIVWGDLAVVVAETDDLNAMVVAFDRADGTRRWTREFSARDSGFIIGEDCLYLALEESSERGTIRALADDGTTIWSREGAFADHVTVGPIVGTDAVYAATREGRLLALARDDGTTLWEHLFQHPTERQPFVTDLVATDCVVVAVVEGTVEALDTDGDRLWEVAGDHGPVTTDGKMVYVATRLGEGESELRALSATDGDDHWTVTKSVDVFHPAVVAGDAVYVRFEDSILAVNKEDGTENWQTDRVLDELALVDGTLYGTTQGNLLAFQ